MYEKIKENLEQNLPPNYSLRWNGNSLNEPIRYKTIDKQKVPKNIDEVWVKAIREITKMKEMQNEKYFRFNMLLEEESVAVTIYNNGTVMVQGDNAGTWADLEMGEICRTLEELLVKEDQTEHNESNQSKQNESIQIKEPEGLCMRCDKKDTRNMI